MAFSVEGSRRGEKFEASGDCKKFHYQALNSFAEFSGELRPIHRPIK
jgi:hypothetical protein